MSHNTLGDDDVASWRGLVTYLKPMEPRMIVLPED